VARSYDGENWEIFHTIAGAGNSTSSINYEVLDQERSYKIRYYKLSQVDFDGSSVDFNILSSNCAHPEAMNELKSSPNPSSNILNLYFNNLTFSGEGKISIYSISGSEVYSKSINVSKGNFVYQLNDLLMEPGVYYIKVISGETSTNIVRQIIL